MSISFVLDLGRLFETGRTAFGADLFAFEDRIGDARSETAGSHEARRRCRG